MRPGPGERSRSRDAGLGGPRSAADAAGHRSEPRARCSTRWSRTRRVRDFIEAQPADSWRDASIADCAGPVEFRAVTSGFERAVTASLGTRRLGHAASALPGRRRPDRASSSGDRRRLPPGIAVIPEPRHAGPRPRTSSPDALALPERAGRGRRRPGRRSGAARRTERHRARYPVFVTVARLPGHHVRPGRLRLARRVRRSDGRRGCGASSDRRRRRRRPGSRRPEGRRRLDRLIRDGSPAWRSLQAAAFDLADGPRRSSSPSTRSMARSISRCSAAGYGDGGYHVYVGLDRDGPADPLRHRLRSSTSLAHA